MLSKLCLKEIEERSSGKVWENSNIRMSVTDIIEPSLFTAAAATSTAAAPATVVASPCTLPNAVQPSAAPKARALNQIQNASPALSKAAAPLPIAAAGVAAGKKRARSEPVFDDAIDADARKQHRKYALWVTGQRTIACRLTSCLTFCRRALCSSSAPGSAVGGKRHLRRRQVAREPVG
jgi:hypothetical protein